MGRGGEREIFLFFFCQFLVGFFANSAVFCSTNPCQYFSSGLVFFYMFQKRFFLYLFFLVLFVVVVLVVLVLVVLVLAVPVLPVLVILVVETKSINLLGASNIPP